MTPPQEFAKQNDAARVVGVNVRTIRRWEKVGLVRGNRIGGLKLYPLDQLRKLARGEVTQAIG